MKYLVALCLALCCLPRVGQAAPVNLAATTCAKYENEILPNAGANQSTDSINTVMWLFGYAIGKSGDHIMYGDALSSFGFGLDAQCKGNPNQVLVEALVAVKPANRNPMDLSSLTCATFVARHTDMAKSDGESADTIMMWLFGFAVAKAGGRVFDGDSLHKFETALLGGCAAAPNTTLYDQLVALKFSG